MNKHALLPMLCASLVKTSHNTRFALDINLAKEAANLSGNLESFFFIDIENSNLHALCADCLSGCAAKT
jgi:hypothetical protein